MTKFRTKKRIEEAGALFKELGALGYRVEQFKPWHYRISHIDYKTRVDIWPTSRKLWVVGGGASQTYVFDQLVSRLEEIFAREDI